MSRGDACFGGRLIPKARAPHRWAYGNASIRLARFGFATQHRPIRPSHRKLRSSAPRQPTEKSQPSGAPRPSAGLISAQEFFDLVSFAVLGS